jgi:hypothetical protein
MPEILSQAEIDQLLSGISDTPTSKPLGGLKGTLPKVRQHLSTYKNKYIAAAAGVGTLGATYLATRPKEMPKNAECKETKKYEKAEDKKEKKFSKKAELVLDKIAMVDNFDGLAFDPAMSKRDQERAKKVIGGLLTTYGPAINDYNSRSPLLGAAGGALLGTAIFPGIGTALGGLWGGKRIRRQKRGIAQQLSQQVHSDLMRQGFAIDQRTNLLVKIADLSDRVYDTEDEWALERGGLSPAAYKKRVDVRARKAYKEDTTTWKANEKRVSAKEVQTPKEYHSSIRGYVALGGVLGGVGGGLLGSATKLHPKLRQIPMGTVGAFAGAGIGAASLGIARAVQGKKPITTYARPVAREYTGYGQAGVDQAIYMSELDKNAALSAEGAAMIKKHQALNNMLRSTAKAEYLKRDAVVTKKLLQKGISPKGATHNAATEALHLEGKNMMGEPLEGFK